MAQYVGYRVKVFLGNNSHLEGTITYVDNVMIKLAQVQTSDVARGEVKELIVKSADIRDLEVIRKEEPQHNTTLKTKRDMHQQQQRPTLSQSADATTTAASSSYAQQPQRAPILRTSGGMHPSMLDPAIISMNAPPPPQQAYGSFPPMLFHPPPPDPNVMMMPVLAPMLAFPSGFQQEDNGGNGQNGRGNKAGNGKDRMNSKSPGRGQRTTSPRKLDRYGRKDNTTFEPIKKEVYKEEFDFEGSNARFNKAEVFAEMLSSSSPPKEDLPLSPSSIPPTTFFTDSDMSVPAVTSYHMNQMYKTIEESGFSFDQMIENAGRSLAQVALKLLQHKSLKVIVLAGIGRNGAGGICAARHLANHKINVFVCRSRAYQLSDEVTRQWAVYKLTTGKEAHVGSLPVGPVGLIIDALVGTKLHGATSGTTALLVGWANSNGAPILSFDVPTGLDASTGRTEGDFIHATTTLTVGLPKTGLVAGKTGSLYFADMGIPSPFFEGIGYESPFDEQFIQKLHHA